MVFQDPQRPNSTVFQESKMRFQALKLYSGVCGGAPENLKFGAT